LVLHRSGFAKRADNVRGFFAHTYGETIGKVTGRMELVLEQEEVEELLREALRDRGMVLSEKMKMVIRQNHKKRSVRVVFQDRPDPRGKKRTGS